MSRASKISERERQAALMLAVEAQTVEELRRAQSIILPGLYGFSIFETSQVLGRARATITRLQNEFRKQLRGETPQRERWGGRRRAYLTDEEEIQFLGEFIEKASEGGVLEVGRIKQAFEKRVGHRVAKTTIYRILERHGWRKLSPRKRHPQTDLNAQAAFKKNSRKLSPGS